MIIVLLKIAAVMQIAVALLNLNLVSLLGWRESLSAMPLLLRQVFMVHLWFISITLAIFGVLTWRFSWEMATNADRAAVWLAGGIGVFWGIRAVMQVLYYSPAHWRGKPHETIIHIALLVAYAGLGALYLWTCAGGIR